MVLDDGASSEFTGRMWREVARAVPEELRDKSALPLERVLWESGVEAIEQVEIEGQPYKWATIQNLSWLHKSGQLEIDGQTWAPRSLQIARPQSVQGSIAHIVDLAPTMAGALGVHSPKSTSGRALAAFPADQVILVVIDGLGYKRYRSTKGQRISPFLDSLGEAKRMLTAYPSVPEVALAALLTGATPDKNGVRSAGAARIGAQTILETMDQAGRDSIAVVGQKPPFSLAPAEVIAPGDRESDLSDQMLAETALDLVGERMPDLLYVHFAGLPQMAVQYGVYSDEEIAKLSEIDGYLNRLLMTVPEHSMMIICGSHGIHPSDVKQAMAGADVGYGSLLSDDMIVPLWILQI